jgi:hypothetical protein
MRVCESFDTWLGSALSVSLDLRAGRPGGEQQVIPKKEGD